MSFNVLNLFNQDTAVAKFSTYHKTNGPNPNDALFYAGTQTLADLIVSQNIAQDPRFLMDEQLPGADSGPVRREVPVLDERAGVG